MQGHAICSYDDPQLFLDIMAMLFASGIEHQPGPGVAAIGYTLLSSLKDTFTIGQTNYALTKEGAGDHFSMEIGNVTSALTHVHDLAERDADAFIAQEHSLPPKERSTIRAIFKKH